MSDFPFAATDGQSAKELTPEFYFIAFWWVLVCPVWTLMCEQADGINTCSDF